MRLWLLMVVAVASTTAPLGAQTPPPAKPAQPAAAQRGQAQPAPPQPAPAPGAAATRPASPQAAPPMPAAPVAPTPTPGAPTAAPAPPAPQTGAPSAPAVPAVQPEPYNYNADGRRDPFTSLIGTGGGEVPSSGGRRNDGPGGMAVADVSVRGILQSRGSLVAMIQGPDNKTYIVHQGDKLLDGIIKTITPQGLIVTQEVNDPLSLVKQREVSKLLRSLEVVKP
jgi:Tfp pilus assembly protein PilP